MRCESQVTRLLRLEALCLTTAPLISDCADVCIDPSAVGSPAMLFSQDSRCFSGLQLQCLMLQSDGFN